MVSESLTIIHLIAQLRFGAGRVVVDTAIEQSHGRKHNVKVCVSTTRMSTGAPIEAGSRAEFHDIQVLTVGDFFIEKQRGSISRSAAVGYKEGSRRSICRSCAYCHAGRGGSLGAAGCPHRYLSWLGRQPPRRYGSGRFPCISALRRR